ncbi:MAG: LexA family protein [Caulobacter sp.]
MLTRAQRQLLDFISAYIAKHRIAPTLVEMQGHMGLSSKSGAHRLLVALEDAGRIVRLPHRRRAIEVVDRSQVLSVPAPHLLRTASDDTLQATFSAISAEIGRRMTAKAIARADEIMGRVG